MLLATDLTQTEQERAQMWELFADLLDFTQEHQFTAKELAKQLPYSKQELNQNLHRLALQNALQTSGKTQNGATIYSFNNTFLGE